MDGRTDEWVDGWMETWEKASNNSQSSVELPHVLCYQQPCYFNRFQQITNWELRIVSESQRNSSKVTTRNDAVCGMNH
jgi:hypothetical protein